jgi:hypothetical protein
MNAPAVPGQFTPELSAQVLALPLISPDRFAELTGVPTGVLRGWMSRGYVPTYSIGKYTLINLALLNHMAMQKAPTL